MNEKTAGRMSANLSKKETYGIRVALADYLKNEGEVDWQETVINIQN